MYLGLKYWTCATVADCCDGSDEYNRKIKCSNTCWEAGKVARDRLKKKIATYQEGVTLRKRDIEQAKLAIAKDEAELTKLKNEEKVLSGLVQELKGIILFSLSIIFSGTKPWYFSADRHPSLLN